MSTGIDVLSVVATVISTMDVAIRAMKELYDARERQAALPRVLWTHRQEMDNTRQLLEVVRQEAVLQVPDLVRDLQQLDAHGADLRRCLAALGRERSPLRQYASQLFAGRRALEDLAAAMAGVGRAKASLGLRIQVIHVGLTRTVGDVVVVNCEAVEALDRKLQALFGRGRGLRLAGLLLQKKRHGDGTIHLKGSDIASLDSDADSTWSVGVGAEEEEEEEGAAGGTTSRTVDRNETTDEAVQVNAPIGIGGFVEVDHLVITNNRALKRSFQINHGISQDNFERVMAMRMRSP